MFIFPGWKTSRGPTSPCFRAGGRVRKASGSRPRLPREALRVIPGGEAGDLQAAIEETVQAARQMRREIEEKIARALEELF